MDVAAGQVDFRDSLPRWASFVLEPFVAPWGGLFPLSTTLEKPHFGILLSLIALHWNAVLTHYIIGNLIKLKKKSWEQAGPGDIDVE